MGEKMTVSKYKPPKGEECKNKKIKKKYSIKKSI